MRVVGVGLGQLLLALDATLVSLVDAPRGLDLPVRSAALIDSDDVRLGLAAAAGSADVFFLLGVTDDELAPPAPLDPRLATVGAPELVASAADQVVAIDEARAVDERGRRTGGS